MRFDGLSERHLDGLCMRSSAGGENRVRRVVVVGLSGSRHERGRGQPARDHGGCAARGGLGCGLRGGLRRGVRGDLRRGLRDGLGRGVSLGAHTVQLPHGLVDGLGRERARGVRHTRGLSRRGVRDTRSVRRTRGVHRSPVQTTGGRLDRFGRERRRHHGNPSGLDARDVDDAVHDGNVGGPAHHRGVGGGVLLERVPGHEGPSEGSPTHGFKRATQGGAATLAAGRLGPRIRRAAGS